MMQGCIGSCSTALVKAGGRNWGLIRPAQQQESESVLSKHDVAYMYSKEYILSSETWYKWAFCRKVLESHVLLGHCDF